MSQDGWEAHYAQGKGFRALSEAERALLSTHVAASEGGAALDVGCGAGELAAYLAELGYQVEAVDYAPAALGRAEDDHGQHGVIFHALDVTRDGLEELQQGFDLITFRLSYAFLGQTVLDRLMPYLRPGGTVCVITPRTETVPDHKRHIALNGEAIVDLQAGWRESTHHDAEDLAFLILRHPAAHESAARDAAAAPWRDHLADQLAKNPYPGSERVEDAVRTVPRHCFLPEASLAEAHMDSAVVTKRTSCGQVTSSVSAPWLQAVMLHHAQLATGAAVLEVGSGGYNAALAAELVGPSGRVVTTDIDPDVTDRARTFLDDAEYPQVRVVEGDAEYGAERHVPDGGWDAILVTVEARDIPPAWYTQLADGGRLVLPLRLHGYTWCVTLLKRDGLLEAENWTVCGFVPMQGCGLGQRADAVIRLRGGEVELTVEDGDPATTPSQLAGVFSTPRTEHWTGVTIPGDTPFDTLQLLHAIQPGFCRLYVAPHLDTGTVAPSHRVPAPALVRGDSLAYLLHRPIHDSPHPQERLAEFGIHAFGPHAEELTAAMATHVHSWSAHYRTTYPHLTVHPRTTRDHELPTGCHTVDKHHTRLVFTYVHP